MLTLCAFLLIVNHTKITLHSKPDIRYLIKYLIMWYGFKTHFGELRHADTHHKDPLFTRAKGSGWRPPGGLCGDRASCSSTL